MAKIGVTPGAEVGEVYARELNSPMTLDSFLRSGLAASTGLLLAMCLLWATIGCSSTLPRKYVHQAEPGVTLTALVTHPDMYEGKVVILGGVIVEETQDGGRIWLRMKNRPLDQDYHPHRPAVVDGPEAGHYWVVVAQDKIPKTYRTWGRVTVIGQLSGDKPTTAKTDPGNEPVLTVMYMRGWGATRETENAWEEFEDPNYRVRRPGGIHGEY
ncbi:MAG: Slp family lipoprotein [Nitrospiraceae bacterium]